MISESLSIKEFCMLQNLKKKFLGDLRAAHLLRSDKSIW